MRESPPWNMASVVARVLKARPLMQRMHLNLHLHFSIHNAYAGMLKVSRPYKIQQG
jgi:hypothetical protein